MDDSSSACYFPGCGAPATTRATIYVDDFKMRVTWKPERDFCDEHVVWIRDHEKRTEFRPLHDTQPAPDDHSHPPAGEPNEGSTTPDDASPV